MNEVTTFDFLCNDETWPVRVVIINGEPWWVARDVCEVFGDTNYRRSVSRLDDDEKGVSPLYTPGGTQRATVINESGLYSLLFHMQPQRKASLTDEQIRHRQEQLRGFKRWVTHDVLPQIRQTGQYVPETGDGRKMPTNFLEALKALVETEESRLELQAQVQTLTPKADAYNRLLSGENTQTMAQVAKTLGTGRNRLFAFLREQKVLMPNNLPYQRYLDRGCFKVREVSVEHSDHSRTNATQTLVTAKGLDLIQALYAKPRQTALPEPKAPRIETFAAPPSQASEIAAVPENECFYCGSKNVEAQRYGKPCCATCAQVKVPQTTLKRTFPDEVLAVRLKLRIANAVHA